MCVSMADIQPAMAEVRWGKKEELEVWANALCDGCPAKYRWRPLFNATKFGWCPLLECRAAKMRNPLKFAGVPQTGKLISAASEPKFTILSEHVEEVLLFNKFFFPIFDTCLSCEDIARQSCAMVHRWRFFGRFFVSCICSEPRAARFRPAF